jgi:hypothetical protein
VGAAAAVAVAAAVSGGDGGIWSSLSLSRLCGLVVSSGRWW